MSVFNFARVTPDILKLTSAFNVNAVLVAVEPNILDLLLVVLFKMVS
jgi:hypothetical protein